MPYDPRVHHRRSIRLQDYDYSQEGAYFVTVCTQGHALLFGDVCDEAVRANDAGGMVQSVWNELPAHYPGVDIDAFQLMPNHLHGIIVLFAGDAKAPGDARAPDPTDRLGHVGPAGTCAMSLPSVVQRLKSLTTTRYAEGVTHHGWPRFKGKLWQRDYYEHVIRDAGELERIRRYVIENPVNWQYDRENPGHKKRDAQAPWEA